MTGFGGEVPAFYHAYRHGYPTAVIDALVDAFELTGQDVVVDFGCGTGQLTLPMAERVSAVVGMDPEPDMLSRARRAGHDAGISNVSWKRGADTDLAGLRGLFGGQPVGAVTVAQALHWMRRDLLFREVAGLVRPGGGIAVVTNGTPLWLQETGWSRALAPQDRFHEHVHVAVLAGVRRAHCHPVALAGAALPASAGNPLGPARARR
jgi:SAM-dependent methyltransferase